MFERHSIRWKLLILVLAANLGTLLVSGGALLYNDLREYRSGLVAELTTQAEILGQASASALEFNDAKVAEENLALLAAKPEILAAAIYSAHGRQFAAYVRHGVAAGDIPLLPEIDGSRVIGDKLILFKRITSRDEILGTVYLKAQYSFYQRLIDYLEILSVVMLISLAVGLVISARLQAAVTNPIQSVSAVAHQVMEQRNFALRAQKTTDDEVGYLVDAFNDMLAEIALRTGELESSKHSLEISERRNRSLISAMSSVVWVSNAVGGFVEPQLPWGSYTGQDWAAYQGLGWRHAFHPDDQASVDRAWALALNQPAQFEVAARLRHAASDRYHEVTLRAVPLTSEAGAVLEWIGSITDIDDRLTAEREVRTLNAELEQRVADRTQQLNEANKDLEGFSYSVSHDLRAPVRAISGFSQMLSQKHGSELSGEARRLLGIVMSEASRMGLLIEDLLAFSRLGRQAMYMVQVDMKELAQGMFEQLAAQHQGPPVRFQLGLLPPCTGDLILLRQVWANLISNAIKFSGKREAPVVEVGAVSDDSVITYFVRDNGAGFDAKYKDKLFGVFQRLHSDSEFPGNGVGLALISRIVMRHGGTVRADGKLNEGATFYFTLPKEPADGNG